MREKVKRNLMDRVKAKRVTFTKKRRGATGKHEKKKKNGGKNNVTWSFLPSTFPVNAVLNLSINNNFRSG